VCLGLCYPPVDFAQAAKGLGCQTWSIDANQSIEDILPAVFSADGPTVIDVTTDPSGYGNQLAAIRE
jgi:thiamine pyrophosphate-dependent acetolactate synthase large subunit-like protein